MRKYNNSMNKHKFIFGCIKKGKLIFMCVVMALVFTSCFTMQKVTAIESSSNGDEKLDFAVVIDAGHGGIDPGSIGYKTRVKESEINLKVSLLLKEKLEKMGVRVVMTRQDDDGLYGLSTKDYKKRDMQKRKEIIEQVRPDIVVSVHMNSYVRHNLRGAQVFYDKSSPKGEALALSIQDQFAEKLPCSDKGVAIGDYFMLKCSPSASVIAECGFLSNEEDEKLLIDSAYQEKLAECIFVGIINFFYSE